MNNSFFKILLGLVLSSVNIFGVEERNPLPFFYLTSKPFKLKANLKNDKLCRVKLNEVVQYKNIELLDCYNLDKKLSETIKLIHEKNQKKNELNLMFVDENKKIINPTLTTSDGNYTIKSILYFKKNKTHHIELTDASSGYFYFTYDPAQILIGD